jgi:hypothetical protein
MDWVTLTRRQVESDALPRVCMACGAPAACVVNKTFSHTPEWVGWLYLAGIIPGIIAEHFFTRQLRVGCPFCRRHRNHWLALYWTAGAGWLAVAALAGLGFLAGAALAPGTLSAGWVGLGVGAGLGLLTWLVPVIYLASTRIGATKVTEDDITLQGVCDAFVKAARDRPPV